MRLVGFCTGCRRFRSVWVTAAGMVALATSGVPQGLCAECEKADGVHPASAWPKPVRRHRGF